MTSTPELTPENLAIVGRLREVYTITAVDLNRLLKAARDEGRRAPDQGWRPIETVPTDETPVLVIGGTLRREIGGDEPCADAVKVSTNNGTYFSVVDTDYYSLYVDGPTHWRPLPEPPGAEKPDQGEETERLAKVYADATGYYVPFHAGLKSESSDQIRAGIRAVLAALSLPNQGEEVERLRARGEQVEQRLSDLARAVLRVMDAREAWRSPDRGNHPNLVLEEAEAWAALRSVMDGQTPTKGTDRG